ncbi:unnamed protein product [Closterium sp. NIES-53]
MNTDLNRPSRKRSMPKKFSREVKDACWNKADVVKGRDPDRWRQDSEGNMVFRAFDSCDGPFCFEYDRIVPRNKGGDSSVDNCTIRQTFLCKTPRSPRDIQILEREFSEADLDLIERSAYGNVTQPPQGSRCSIQ